MDRETCADCGKEAPQTETNYTLISAQFGWRLTRSKTPSGDLVVAWRCPTCWREYKRQRPGTITGSGVSEERSTVPPPAAPAEAHAKPARRSSPPLRGATRTTSAPPAPPKPAPPRPSAAPGPAKRPSVPARRRPT